MSEYGAKSSNPYKGTVHCTLILVWCQFLEKECTARIGFRHSIRARRVNRVLHSSTSLSITFTWRGRYFDNTVGNRFAPFKLNPIFRGLTDVVLSVKKKIPNQNFNWRFDDSSSSFSNSESQIPMHECFMYKNACESLAACD